MPLSKQAKALYEAALRRKGLQPGKAVRQDPRTFVGPIRMQRHKYPQSFATPVDTYWNNRGRFQDLEDELSAAIDAGIWERRNPMARQYYRYYNDGDLPRGIRRMSDVGLYYEDPSRYTFEYSSVYPSGRKFDRRALTRLGELELEARADEMIENDYKDYLRKMYQRFPNRAAVLEQAPEYKYLPYLDELFPE